jgi:hypothetical protein
MPDYNTTYTVVGSPRSSDKPGLPHDLTPMAYEHTTDGTEFLEALAPAGYNSMWLQPQYYVACG